jgi:hypothetical protein
MTCDARQHAGPQKLFRRLEGDGPVSSRFQNAPERLTDTMIVVHRCDDHSRLWHHDAPICMPGMVRTARVAGYYRFI